MDKKIFNPNDEYSICNPNKTNWAKYEEIIDYLQKDNLQLTKDNKTLKEQIKELETK